MKTAEMVKGIFRTEDYTHVLAGLLAYEKDIELTEENFHKLCEIVNKWFDSDYDLLNECFSDTEYDLFTEEEFNFLGGE